MKNGSDRKPPPLEQFLLVTQSGSEAVYMHSRFEKAASFEFRGAQSGYGFGWFLTSHKGHRLNTHGGTVSGFSGVIYRFVDDKATIIVLTNSKSGPDRIGYSEVLANGLADLLGL